MSGGPVNILPGNASTPSVKRRTFGRTIARLGAVALILFWLGVLVVGVVLVKSGLEARQEAAAITGALVCAPGQVSGCRLHEEVTIIDLNSYYHARGPTERFVKVQIPDGTIQNVENYDGDLFPQLYVTQQVEAELWKGSVIRLEDGAGRYLVATDSPLVTGATYPTLGAFLAIAGCAFLILTVIGLRRQRQIRR